MDIVTGVLNFNVLDMDMLDNLISNSIDTEWEIAIEGKNEEEIEEIGDCWESSESVYLHGFKRNDDGKYEEDTSKELIVKINMEHGGTVQIVRSKHVMDNVDFCSPCYPGQADLESEDGNLTAYILSPEYFIESEFDISKIREI